MSMRMTAEDLLKIQAAVREIQNMKVRVTEMEAAGHRILLDWDDGVPFVKGILRLTEHKSGHSSGHVGSGIGGNCR